MDALLRYEEAIEYIDRLAQLPLKNNYMLGDPRPSVFLERTKYFLDLLGNPQEGFKYVHIAGTSGKGTVTAMVHNGLHRAGKRVGSFSSPYVTAATEKICVGGLYISPEQFADIVNEVKPHIQAAESGPHGRPTYFEIFFAIALVYFKRKLCEWVVLEVGLGGRYDATNTIERPVVTAVTNIDYDHVHLLGKTLRSIAENKIGIVKEGSHFFTTEKRPALLKLFKKRCNDADALFTALPVHLYYQENNKTLARAILRSIAISDGEIEQGIIAAKLPCRFEVMQRKPLVILDGAHNRAKMRSTITNLKKLRYRDLHLIIGIGILKDADSLLKEILPLARRVYLTSFNRIGVTPALPRDLFKIAHRYAKPGVPIEVYDSAEIALSASQKCASKSDCVLVTGSFYLSGELRKRWYSEKWVLKKRRSF